MLFSKFVYKQKKYSKCHNFIICLCKPEATQAAPMHAQNLFQSKHSLLISSTRLQKLHISSALDNTNVFFVRLPGDNPSSEQHNLFFLSGIWPFLVYVVSDSPLNLCHLWHDDTRTVCSLPGGSNLHEAQDIPTNVQLGSAGGRNVWTPPTLLYDNVPVDCLGRLQADRVNLGQHAPRIPHRMRNGERGKVLENLF